MQLLDFQLHTIGKLMEAMNSKKSEIILKSPTGSGKTIMLTHFMDEYCKSVAKTVFIWLTPGKGDLEEQSKAKMDKSFVDTITAKITAVNNAIHGDEMLRGMEIGHSYFCNFEGFKKGGEAAWWADICEYELFPYLEEVCYDSVDRLDELKKMLAL